MKGRVILDCSTLLPGPFIGKLLAQQGARVIKVENPERPDGARQIGKSYYDDLNSMKELVQLNLMKPADQAEFRKLVAKADGLIEGFRPQAKLKLGLDEKTLHATNPKLCILSLVGYPEDGPWRDRAGHDMNFAAVTGALSLFNGLPGLPLADLFAAYESAISLACALDDVSRGGSGRRVVVSMSEALRRVQSLWIAEYRDTGVAPHPGNTLMTGKYPCYNLYAAADGRKVAVGSIEHKFWERVCGILGLPDCVSQGYATGAQGEAVKAKVQAAFARRPWSEWAPLFDAADCCVEPVLDYPEVYSRGV